MDTFGSLPGPVQQMPDQGPEASHSHPLFPARTELTGSCRSPPFLGQNENVPVKKEQLHCKGARHSQLFKCLADPGKTGQCEEYEGAADCQDASGDDREKRQPSARDGQRTCLQNNRPVDKRVEYPDYNHERAEKQDLSCDIREREIPCSDHCCRENKEGEER